MLDDLERELPGMLERSSGESDFLPAFSARANEIRDAAGPHDLVHVDGRIGQLLSAAGLTEKPEH